MACNFPQFWALSPLSTTIESLFFVALRLPLTIQVCAWYTGCQEFACQELTHRLAFQHPVRPQIVINGRGGFQTEKFSVASKNI